MILPRQIWKSRAKVRPVENNNPGVLAAGIFRAREADFYVLIDVRGCACSHEGSNRIVPYSSSIQRCPRSDDSEGDCCNIYRQLREML